MQYSLVSGLSELHSAAFTVGSDHLSLSAVLAVEKLSAEHQQELSDFYQNATAFLCTSTSYFIGHCVVCTFGWPLALPRGALVSGSHSAEACPLLIFDRRVQRMVR